MTNDFAGVNVSQIPNVAVFLESDVAARITAGEPIGQKSNREIRLRFVGRDSSVQRNHWTTVGGFENGSAPRTDLIDAIARRSGVGADGFEMDAGDDLPFIQQQTEMTDIGVSVTGDGGKGLQC